MTLSHSRIQTISVIGAGAWGTALARLLALKGYHVRLWAYEADVVATIRSKRENSRYLPHVELPETLHATRALPDSLAGSDLLVFAVPSHAMQNIIERLGPFLTKPLPITIATKGIEEDTLRLMSEVIESLLPLPWHRLVTVLSGPSFAMEVCQGKPTTILLAGRDAEIVTTLQQVFFTPRFRVYAGRDPIGAQIGGALKNVMAIAAGIVDGLDLGSNARAALITRGLAEMVRLGVRMGAERATLYGLSGLGDLVLTCTGPLSRNHTVGVKLGKGVRLNTILSQTHTVAEGIRTTRAALTLSKRHGIEMPIVQSTFAVLFEEQDPREAVETLMTRSAKAEDSEDTRLPDEP